MGITPDSMRLDDRLVLVTGAAQGIGAATAIACASFGADVAVCDREEALLAETVAAIEAEGRRAYSAVLDVRDGEAVHAWIGGLPTPLVGVVNNAGGGFHANFTDVNDKGQDALMRENFTSVAHVVRASLAKMPKDGRGSIVNVTSIEAHRAAPGYAIYSAMKAAVVSLSKSLALEIGDLRIRVNCVAPDVIPTPGTGGDMPVRTPLPIAGHVDDVAGAIVFLLSDLARFITGTTLHVDGGNWAKGGWIRSGNNGTWVTG
jgi:NAD(P)-dependent dehydrogenase (short-subunit alcohol dehydrogenase family)